MMGTVGCYTYKIEEETISKALGEKASLLTNFKDKLKAVEQQDPNYGVSDWVSRNDEFDPNPTKVVADCDKAFIALRKAFKKATGLTLLCNYHEKDNCYDEVEGFWFHIPEDDLYITKKTKELKNLEKLAGNGCVTQCAYTEFG